MAPTILFDWFPDDLIDQFMELYMKHGFQGLCYLRGHSMLRMVDGYFSGGNKALPDSEPYIDRSGVPNVGRLAGHCLLYICRNEKRHAGYLKPKDHD